jgi:hypothetical protein
MHMHAGHRIVCSAGQVAGALWKHGEDSLVTRAWSMSHAELEHLWLIAGDLWTPDHGLPLAARLTADKAITFAAIVLFEGKLRRLAQERRRPAKEMPQYLMEAPGPQPDWSVDPGEQPGEPCLPRRL